MPGLTEKAHEGQTLFVYNDGRRWPHAADGAHLWCGVVLKVVADDPDPQKCVYEMWGPGGEESSPWPGSCLERRPRAAPPPDRPRAAPPTEPNPLDTPLTLDTLRVGVNAGLAQVPVADRPAATAAVRALVPAWEVRIRSGQGLTIWNLMCQMRDFASAANAFTSALVTALVPRPSTKPEAPADGEE